jgi:hypothetical protein
VLQPVGLHGLIQGSLYIFLPLIWLTFSLENSRRMCTVSVAAEEYWEICTARAYTCIQVVAFEAIVTKVLMYRPYRLRFQNNLLATLFAGWLRCWTASLKTWLTRIVELIWKFWVTMLFPPDPFNFQELFRTFDEDFGVRGAYTCSRLTGVSDSN